MARKSASAPTVSLLIPVYNEVESIQSLMEEVLASEFPSLPGFQLLLIDDGSSDGTTEKIEALTRKYPFVKCFRLEPNKGKSAAWHLGFKVATTDIIVTIDADLQNDPKDAVRAYRKLAKGGDMVSGQRRRRADTFWRKVQSRIANHTRRAVLKDRCLDVGCGLKAFRREKVVHVPYFRGMHRFMEALHIALGFDDIRVLMVDDRPRKFGEPKFGFRNRGFSTLFDLLGVWWLKQRLTVYHHRQIHQDTE